VAHFSLEKSSIPPEKFAKALNAYLPSDIRVLDSRLVDEDFNACTSAKRKTYRYSLYLSEIEQPLKQRYATCVHGKVDIDLVKKGAELFVGEHDFACFNASGSGAKTTVRTIYNIDIIQNNQDLFIEVTGNGFLYNMVRIIVGTAVYVSDGRINPMNTEEILNSKKRDLAGITAPPMGLSLEKVHY
jgi:tRNA pseudouridine38-40 synthase